MAMPSTRRVFHGQRRGRGPMSFRIPARLSRGERSDDPVKGAHMSAEARTQTTVNQERRAAHERLSTGALARWARVCATHPWRVIGGSLATIVLLIALVATVGGGLKDEFEIPGSDTQKAT